MPLILILIENTSFVIKKIKYFFTFEKQKIRKIKKLFLSNLIPAQKKFFSGHIIYVFSTQL